MFDDHDDKTADELQLFLRDPDEPLAVQVDLMKYAHLLEDADMSDVQKLEALRALWNVIVAFVDLGFGVHPVQESCGQIEQTKAEGAEPNDQIC